MQTGHDSFNQSQFTDIQVTSKVLLLQRTLQGNLVPLLELSQNENSELKFPNSNSISYTLTVFLTILFY